MTRPRFELALALMLGSALGGGAAACFSAPDDDVLFSCELEGDDRCPPDYRCEADNCCHRIGSDVQDNFGACALGGNSGGQTTQTETETDTGETGETGDTETGG